MVEVFTRGTQAFSFEMGHFWSVLMTRLAGVCTGLIWPA